MHWLCKGRNDMTTSVCMGLYNGAEYIEEQLYSILHQTKAPDEVILCDDGSTDDTVALVQHFIQANALEKHWKLYCNEKTKGYPGNFYYACSLCTQEIVFLADQDDIWEKHKIQHMCEVLEQQPQAKSVCCKFGLIDTNGAEIHTVMAPTHASGTGQLRSISVADVFYKCEWPGMVMAFRRAWYWQWIDQLCPGGAEKGFPGIPHDFCICAKAAEENGFLQLDEELAFHRRHDHNAGGEEHRLKVLLNKQRKLEEVAKYLNILTNFKSEFVLQTAEGKSALERKYCSMEARHQALASGSMLQVICAAHNYKDYVRPVTVICDLLIVKRR